MKELKTAKQIIENLGGVNAVTDLAGSDRKVVYHWRSKGEFPAALYFAMITHLNRCGFTARPELWAQKALESLDPESAKRKEIAKLESQLEKLKAELKNRD